MIGEGHIPKFIHRDHALKKVHGDHAVGRFNAKLAVWITKHVGTMWCAYIFAVLGIAGVVGALGGNAALVLIVGAISGFFLQLVLLPIIIVGQNISQALSDARAEEDHKTITVMHAMLKKALDDLDIIRGRSKPKA